MNPLKTKMILQLSAEGLKKKKKVGVEIEEQII